MGKRLRLEEEDEDLIFSRSVKDDRATADKVTTAAELDKLLDRNGAVANEIQDREWGKNLVSYNPDGSRRIEAGRVEGEIKDLRQEIIGSRNYSKKYTDTLLDQQTILREDGKILTNREKRNLNARRYQVRAKALLTLARVGKVKISPYDRGILNGLAEGNYDTVVYGAEDERGNRRYERGTLVTEYERSTAGNSARSRDPSARARGAELAERLREANAGGRRSGDATGYSQNRFYDEIRRTA